MPSSQISKKKLKAIVFTDIVDFTKISAQDEQKALDIIQTQHDIIKPIVNKHNGEWLKEIGDGLLFSFDSSLEAVRCSIEIQETIRTINDFNIRIGIHQGDIFIKGGDVFGDDVNIASRVEGFAPSGGISISDKVHKDISGVSDIHTSFIGHRKLKGVEQETKLRCIVSNNLPAVQTNPLINFFGGFFIFFGILSIINALYTGIDYLYQESSILHGTEFDSSITELFMGITMVLIGYNNYSYTKGVSIRAQRNFIFLGIIIFMWIVFQIYRGYSACDTCP